MTAGYSGTPLVRKLGIKAGMTCAVLNPPSNYWDLLPGLPEDLTIIDDSAAGVDFVHLFVYDWELAAHAAERQGRPDWSSWLRSGRAKI